MRAFTRGVRVQRRVAPAAAATGWFRPAAAREAYAPGTPSGPRRRRTATAAATARRPRRRADATTLPDRLRDVRVFAPSFVVVRLPTLPTPSVRFSRNADRVVAAVRRDVAGHGDGPVQGDVPPIRHAEHLALVLDVQVLAEQGHARSCTRACFAAGPPRRTARRTGGTKPGARRCRGSARASRPAAIGASPATGAPRASRRRRPARRRPRRPRRRRTGCPPRTRSRSERRRDARRARGARARTGDEEPPGAPVDIGLGWRRAEARPRPPWRGARASAASAGLCGAEGVRHRGEPRDRRRRGPRA